jgi:hypothetical protein
MNRTKIILCGRKDYERHHRPKGLAVAYINRKPFIKNLPKLKKGTCNMTHEDEADNIPFTFEELVHFSIEMFKKS